MVLAGKWPEGDDSFAGAYEGWPLGLVLEVFPKAPPAAAHSLQLGGGGEEGGEEMAAEGAAGLRGAGFVAWVKESAQKLPPIDDAVSLRALAQRRRMRDDQSLRFVDKGMSEGSRGDNLDNWDLVSAGRYTRSRLLLCADTRSRLLTCADAGAVAHATGCYRPANGCVYSRK